MRATQLAFVCPCVEPLLVAPSERARAPGAHLEEFTNREASSIVSAHCLHVFDCGQEASREEEAALNRERASEGTPTRIANKQDRQERSEGQVGKGKKGKCSVFVLFA